MNVRVTDLRPGDRLVRCAATVDAVLPTHVPGYVLLALEDDPEMPHPVSINAVYEVAERRSTFAACPTGHSVTVDDLSTVTCPFCGALWATIRTIR